MTLRSTMMCALLVLPSAAMLHAEEAATAAPAATVTVTGTAQVGAAPDMAVVSVGVVASAPTAAGALASSGSDMAALLELLASQGVAARDMQTTGLNLGPVYDRSGDTTRLTGFEASNSLTVKVRALDTLGGLLDAMVMNGANQLGGLSFDIAEPQALEDRAREAAVADAARRAGLLAGAAGLSLGPVLTINEGSVGRGGPVVYARMAAAPVPLAEGEVSIEASVTITYALFAK